MYTPRSQCLNYSPPQNDNAIVDHSSQTMASTCSSKQGRHLACVLCRDRKVKCDGGKPACEKCIRVGEKCIYSVASKASRTELQETILQLNERIEQTEAKQAAFMAHQQKRTNCTCHCPLMPETQLLDPFTTLDQPHAENRPSSPNINNVISVGFSPLPDIDPLQNRNCNSIFPLDARASRFFPLGISSAHPGAVTTPAGVNTEIISSPAGTDQSMSQLDLSQLSREPDSCSASSANTVSESFQVANPDLPSLPGAQGWPRLPSGLPEYGSMNMDTTSGDEADRLMDEFISLSGVTEAAQYKIISVAETAATYANYFQKLCIGGKQDPENLVKFLDSLHHRMREIRDLASQQVLGQALKSREALRQQDAYRDRIKQYDDEHRRRAHASLDFFRARYDFQSPLSHQL